VTGLIGLTLAATMLVSSDLECRTSIEEWDTFLLTRFGEQPLMQGTSMAGYDYWFYRGAESWTVVVYDLYRGNGYCTSIHMTGKLTEPGVIL